MARRIDLTRVERTLRKPWYAGWRLLERAAFSGREYSIHVPYGQRILTPWYHEEGAFGAAMARVRAAGPMAVSADRCYLLFELARTFAAQPGAVAECGVFTGGTAQLLAEVTNATIDGRALHLFDSFAGMPETADPSRDYHAPGDFGDTSEAAVRRRLAPYDGVEFHVGFMPDTFTEVAGVDTYTFVHIDVDIFESVRDCCRWFWPRLAPGGCLVFDDYGFYPYRRAARAAVDGFFLEHDRTPIALPTGQAIVIKTGL